MNSVTNSSSNDMATYFPAAGTTDLCYFCREDLTDDVVAHTMPSQKLKPNQNPNQLWHPVHKTCLATFATFKTIKCYVCFSETDTSKIFTLSDNVKIKINSILNNKAGIVGSLLFGVTYYSVSYLSFSNRDDYSAFLNTSLFLSLGAIGEIFTHNITCLSQEDAHAYPNSQRLGLKMFISASVKTVWDLFALSVIAPFIRMPIQSKKMLERLEDGRLYYIDSQSKIDLALFIVTIGSLFARIVIFKSPTVHRVVHQITPRSVFNSIPKIWNYLKESFTFDVKLTLPNDL